MAITKTKAATESHIRLVRCDPDFISEFNSIPNDIGVEALNKSVSDLYGRYGLKIDDLDVSLNQLKCLLSPLTMFSAGSIKHNSDKHEFEAVFDENIRKKQFMELWNLIKKNKADKNIIITKLKPPQEDVLLYAIFKAKMAYRTFKEIFEDYCNSTLLYYENKSNDQFKSEDELEKYYRKFYKPEL